MQKDLRLYMRKAHISDVRRILFRKINNIDVLTLIGPLFSYNVKSIFLSVKTSTFFFFPDQAISYLTIDGLTILQHQIGETILLLVHKLLIT
jgi:hypothetical protein